MRKKNLAVFFTLTIIIAGSLALPAAARAIDLSGVRNAAIGANLPNYGTFQGIFEVAIRILLSLAFISAVLFIVISGYRFITSAGNEEMVEKAKKNLLWAVVGLVVILLAWIILSVIVTTINTGSAGTVPPPPTSSGR